MPLQIGNYARPLKGAGLGLLLSVFALEPLAAATGPFTQLEGRWSGGGTISVSGQGKERIRCKVAYYTTELGRTFQQNMTCASDSYKFVVVSEIYDKGGSISGSWTESTRKANGSVSGRADNTKINATVRGTGFSATISITWSGNSQSVLIRPKGTDVTEVSIALKRTSK